MSIKKLVDALPMPASWRDSKWRESLLDEHVLLLGVHPALQVLSGDGDEALAGRKRAGEVAEAAVGADDGHFSAVHHHARVQIGVATHLDHAPVLDESIQHQAHGGVVEPVGNDGET